MWVSLADGKPSERLGRKASGLKALAEDSRAAESSKETLTLAIPSSDPYPSIQMLSRNSGIHIFNGGLMAFVNQEVPANFVFDPKIFFNPSTHSPITPEWVRRWAIDHERNIFLVRLRAEIPAGGGPNLPGIYAISCNGFVIKFKALQTTFRNQRKGLSINWEVLKFELPLEKLKQSEYFEGLISEALQAYGNSLGHKDSSIVAVNVSVLKG